MIRALFNNILNSGVKPTFAHWEIHLTRKLNSIALIGFFNMLVAVVVYSLLGYDYFLYDCLFASFALIGVILLNKYKNYFWAFHFFFLYGFFFLLSLNLKMGINSFIILFFFPVIISMVQLLGRRETIKHLYFLAVACLITIIGVLIGYHYHYMEVPINKEIISNISNLNIFLAFTSTIGFAIAIASETISQDRVIKKILDEKEILIAEVFHRVKNNMNIVTSLLNLKKNSSSSPEVIDALDECRNRIFSMALVHQNIFNSNNSVGLNFKEYVETLVPEIATSLAEKDTYSIQLELQDVNLEISNAIPCGLILNELLTNSFKYAQNDLEKLHIHVILNKNINEIELIVKDNGKSFDEEKISNSNGLGIELIKSLSEQIDGTYSFSYQNGFVFQLKFNINQTK